MSTNVTFWTTGTRQPNFRRSGTPAELLKWVAYFPPSEDVPPRVVMNDVFRKGFRDGGFNGDTHWEPFELDAAEYDELVRALLADDTKQYRTVESPDWIQREPDWIAFVSWKRTGVPLEPYRALLYQFDALTTKLSEARANGSRLQLIATNLRLYLLTRRMHRLLAPYAQRVGGARL
jgi:hypothetical protein